jgi:hypothetical protein
MIEFLIHGPGGTPGLRRQADRAKVVATCSCGCPSVWLGIPDEDGTQDDGSGHVPLRAIQRKSRGITEVTVHVVGGRLFELEIFGSATGVRPRVDSTRLEYA